MDCLCLHPRRSRKRRSAAERAAKDAQEILEAETIVMSLYAEATALVAQSSPEHSPLTRDKEVDDIAAEEWLQKAAEEGKAAAERAAAEEADAKKEVEEKIAAVARKRAAEEAAADERAAAEGMAVADAVDLDVAVEKAVAYEVGVEGFQSFL